MVSRAFSINLSVMLPFMFLHKSSALLDVSNSVIRSVAGFAFCLAASATLVTAAASDPVLPDEDAVNPALVPLAVTQPVSADSDDPAIWIHPTEPARSLVIGTDKTKAGALYAFDLKGAIIAKSIPLARPNNVDIAQGVVFGKKRLDLAVTTERKELRLRFFTLPDMTCVDAGDLLVFDGDESRAPMGVALYQRPRDGALFVIVGGKSGPTEGYLWQYRVQLRRDGKIGLRKVREFGRYSGRKEIEAIAVDSELGHVYYSDEQYGIHKYAADPDAPDANRELALFGTSGFASDIEGISVLRTGAGKGYLLVSNQQADTFRIFPREGTKSTPHHHPFLASVRVSTRESDGSDVTSVALPGYPGGLFVAMSADRTFHYYSVESLLKAAGLAK